MWCLLRCVGSCTRSLLALPLPVSVLAKQGKGEVTAWKNKVVRNHKGQCTQPAIATPPHVHSHCKCVGARALPGLFFLLRATRILHRPHGGISTAKIHLPARLKNREHQGQCLHAHDQREAWLSVSSVGQVQYSQLLPNHTLGPPNLQTHCKRVDQIDISEEASSQNQHTLFATATIVWAA